MVVNGRLFKVAATLCGLTLTIYAIYVYREVTSEFQQCEKDVSGKLVGPQLVGGVDSEFSIYAFT